MRVGIVGGGAVGLALGSFLIAAGASVRFVVRSPSDRKALAKRGLARVGLFGNAQHPPEAFALDTGIEDLRGAPIDFLLVCSKSTSSGEIADELARIWTDFPGGLRGGLRPGVRHGPQVVLCQNGWGNADLFSARLAREQVWNARIITGFRRSEPNCVEVTVHAEPVRLGSLHAADPVLLEPLRAALERGGLPCELSRSIERDLWAKMLYNCALNPLGALLGVPYGELAERDASREILEAVIREIFLILEPAGYATHWTSAADYLRVFYDELLPPTASHESSMLQDTRAGRPSEIDSLCGAVSLLGTQYGVATPVNTALTQLIHALEDR